MKMNEKWHVPSPRFVGLFVLERGKNIFKKRCGPNYSPSRLILALFLMGESSLRLKTNQTIVLSNFASKGSFNTSSKLYGSTSSARMGFYRA
jgi:hypothetical protein